MVFSVRTSTRGPSLGFLMRQNITRCPRLTLSGATFSHNLLDILQVTGRFCRRYSQGHMLLVRLSEGPLHHTSRCVRSGTQLPIAP